MFRKRDSTTSGDTNKCLRYGLTSQVQASSNINTTIGTTSSGALSLSERVLAPDTNTYVARRYTMQLGGGGRRSKRQPISALHTYGDLFRGAFNQLQCCIA